MHRPPQDVVPVPSSQLLPHPLGGSVLPGATSEGARVRRATVIALLGRILMTAAVSALLIFSLFQACVVK